MVSAAGGEGPKVDDAVDGPEVSPLVVCEENW